MTDTWELVTRWPGGTVSALASADRDGEPLVVAATAAGLHTSSDGGRSWTVVGLGPLAVIDAVGLSPDVARDGHVLAGTAAGLHRSTDGGQSWRAVLSGSRVQAIALAPDFAASGITLVGTEDDGVLRSEDGGQDWDGASAGLLDLSVTALTISPAFPRDRTAFAGTTTGLYRSRNGGRAWRYVELGPEQAAVQTIAVSPDFEVDGRVWAGTEADGLFRSDDGGETWEPVATPGGPSVTCLSVARLGGDRLAVAAGTADGAIVSLDGGRSWRQVGAGVGPVLSAAIVAGDDPALLLGTIAQGIVRAALDSSAWSLANAGLAGRATVSLAVAATANPEPVLAVASLDGGVFVSPDGGTTWTGPGSALDAHGATSVGLVEGAAERPALLATAGGRLYRSDDLGASWGPAPLDGLGLGPDSPFTVVSVTPGAPGSMPAVLVAGRRALALSAEGGASWQSVALPDPSAEIVGGTAAGGGRDGTLYVVTRAHPAAPGRHGDSTGLVLWRSSDLGQTWARWLEAPNATVMPLAIPPGPILDPVLLVGVPGRISSPLRNTREVRGRDRRPLWQSTRIGDPLTPVTALALSPRFAHDRTVLAAGQGVVYRSRDNGASFEGWDHGLSVPLVTGLGITGAANGSRTAYALGLGGTLWRRRLT